MHSLIVLLSLCSAATASTWQLSEVDSSSWAGDRLRNFRLAFSSQASDVLECAAVAAKHLLVDQLLVFIAGGRGSESQCFLAAMTRCLRLPSSARVTGMEAKPLVVLVKSLNSCWTTIQHRVDNSTDFYRNWSDYAVGFGQGPSGNFWIGLRTLHALTWPVPRTLRVRMRQWNDSEHWAEYSSFSVGSEAEKFRLNVSGFSSSSSLVGDSMAYHNGRNFSTLDDNNENGYFNCAQWFKGGWWYRLCHNTNPNGLYYNLPQAKNITLSATGISWYYYFTHSYSMKEFEMLIY